MSITPNENKTPLKKKFLPFAITAVVALALGAIIGGASAEGSTTTAASSPEKTVMVTAPAVAPVVKTVEKVTVPKECLDALDEADRGFTLAADLTSEFQDAITAIQSSDVSGINSSIDNIKSINTSLGNLSPDYNANKLICRGAAE